MTLLIASGFDANNETLPLAWALVPIESGAWWKWFLKQLKKAFDDIPDDGNCVIFMSDREKGLLDALAVVFPEAIPVYCCQHIADNV
jgi:hypothetical protein